MFDFDAGRYAIFWPAYAVTGLVLAVLILDTLLRARRWRRAAETAKTLRPEGDAPQ
jgi:heme exporter protein CcmD